MQEAWLDVCSAEELEPGEGRAFDVGGEKIAVFRLKSGELCSIEDTCPHAYGSLGEGMLIRDTKVACASHGWPFDLHTGVCTLKPEIRLARFAVREQEGFIQIAPGTRL